MAQQTAVEWLIEQVNSEQYQIAFGQTYISIDLIEQAKQMEKEQLVKAWDDGDYAYFYSKETGRDLIMENNTITNYVRLTYQTILRKRMVYHTYHGLGLWILFYSKTQLHHGDMVNLNSLVKHSWYSAQSMRLVSL